MPDQLSGSQLEKLGTRLRTGPLTLADLRQLRGYLETLESFAEQTFSTVTNLRHVFGGLRPAQITRRNVKTVRSIVAKLRRQSTTLRQIQDLVGCRVVVSDIIDQDQWSHALERSFPGAQIVDLRLDHQHGYRAIHAIVRDGNKRFEIQVRTVFQDEWANLVEKIDDRLDQELKYGSGDPGLAEALEGISRSFAHLEAFQQAFQAKPVTDKSCLEKLIICTYLDDYENALKAAYPADQQRAEEEAWQAARRERRPVQAPRNRGIDASEVFIFSEAYHAALRRAEAQAERFLRLVIWSSVELAGGSEIVVGGSGGRKTETVTVLREIDAEAKIAVATLDKLEGGYIYEITQPSAPQSYLLSDVTFGDMLSDAEVDILNLAARLRLEGYTV